MVDYVESSYVTYEKTNNYWQTDESLVATRSKSNIDTVKWVIIYETSASAVAVETGEIDMSHTTNASDYGLYMDTDGKAYDGYKAVISNSNMLYGMTFNCGDNSICSDINLRKAICYAIDAEAIAANVFKGYGRAVGSYVHPAYADYAPEMEDLNNYYRYNIATAKDYLSKSNYNGEVVKILVAPTGSTPATAILVQAYLSAIGINCQLLAYESATFNSYLYEETGSVWDFVVTANQGASGAEYLWAILFANDNSLYSYGSLQHIRDNRLQTLYEAMFGVDTNNTKTVSAFLDYLNDQCYQYGIMCFDKYTFGGGRVTDLVLNGLGHIIPGACTVLPD
jgi:ABC-type transport system substrate-binding protein